MFTNRLLKLSFGLIIFSFVSTLAWADDCPTAQMSTLTFPAGSYSDCSSSANTIVIQSGAHISKGNFSGSSTLTVDKGAVLFNSNIQATTLNINGTVIYSKLSAGALNISGEGKVAENSTIISTDALNMADNASIINSTVTDVTSFKLGNSAIGVKLTGTSISGNGTNINKKCFQQMGAAQTSFTLYGLGCPN